MTLLNVKHRISAARAPRSNGLAESLVKRLSDLIKIYVKTDSEIADYLPLIEMILRSTTHSKLKISSHEVYFGSRMNLGDSFALNNTSKLTSISALILSGSNIDLRIFIKQLRRT